jgi:hypothetical protein
MKLGLIISCALMFGATGIATAQSSHWHAERFTQSLDKRGSAAGDFIYTGVKVTSKNPDQPEIRFGCSKRYGLTATITFLPLSQAEDRPNSRFKLRQKISTLTIEGREPERVPWTVIKETRTVQTRSGKHAAMIYNAVVQQTPFVVKEPYKKDITITPPPIDPHFVFFVESCEVTSGA